ncbi:MAG: 4Fe-4S dicluster domain-containing protein [Sedimentisphaerales bacterium]|nr:4Fe-4S dicluster domain-containing protein [Sedimentisphaerales bacterium]
MESFFVSKLKPLMDAIAGTMDLYVPKRAGEHFVFNLYNPSATDDIEFNSIRACTPVKEFLFPIREVAATYPNPTKPEEIKPFAVFGLKDCDLKSLAILDKVFTEADFEDPLYTARREKMFIISSDCTEPGESCFCCLFDGKVFSRTGFDLNISQIKDGFIVEPGSGKGHGFIESHSQLFADVPQSLFDERNENRSGIQKLLEEMNNQYRSWADIKEAVENSEDSEIYNEQAAGCIECQACTRVCPTCHCFYLYDAKQSDYFTKMKIWDSCMRFTYAAVAGGANPNKVLGDRMKHRLMHKFVHFMERYGINMCVGCGRCVDADAGGMDLREILKRLSEEEKGKVKK